MTTLSTKDRVLTALQGYGFKRESVNGDKESWRGNSPFRPSSDSRAFTVTFEGDEHGAFCDHARPDEERGSLYDLAKRMGIEPNANRKPAEPTKRGYIDLAEYAVAHGVTDDVLKAAQWADGGTKNDRPAFTFKTANGTRYRFKDGAKPAYGNDYGYKACWYGLKRAIEMAREQNTPVVLCNGEISTVSAQHWGIPAACVTNGEHAIPPELLTEFQTAWRGGVIIALDCDAAGISAAQKIKAQFTDRPALVVDLGFSDGGDLADFARLYGKEAMTELVKRATPQVAPPPPEVTPVQELAKALRELETARKAEKSAERDTQIEVLVSRAEALVDNVRAESARPSIITFADAVRANRERAAMLAETPGDVRGLVTKMPSLDRITGGLTPELYILYGATSMGKSTMMASWAARLLEQGAGFFVTTESSPNRFLDKIVSAATHIPIDKMETGRLTADEYKRWMTAYAGLERMRCGMLNHPSPTPKMVRAAVLEGMQTSGYEFVMVDSASKMSGGAGASGIYEKTAAVSDGLQDLWRELNIPVIATTQVGRDVGERPAGKKIPQIEDGYGGGVIEFNAGCVLAVYRHDYYVKAGTEQPSDQFPEGTALIRCLKHRWRDSAGKDVMLQLVGGACFYEQAPLSIARKAAA